MHCASLQLSKMYFIPSPLTFQSVLYRSDFLAVPQYKLSIKQASPVSSHESAIGTLQRCMFHGCMHAFLTGSCVATYHLAFMSKEAAEDISYRIVHAPYQNMIDSCSMLGASMGVLYGLLIRTFDHHKDPFVRKSMLQNMISNTSSVYQRIFSFSWMNPKIRHITSFGCIGVGGGVAFHFAATRNMVSPKQLWVYTVKCVS